MARTAIVPVAVTAAGVAPGAGTTIDSTLVTNGVKIDCAALTSRVHLRFKNTAVSPKNAIIKANIDTEGTAYYAHLALQGDLTLAVAESSGELNVIGLEAARFVQTGGYLYIDFETGFTGTLWVETVPYPLP